MRCFKRFKSGNVNVFIELVDDISERCLQSAEFGSGNPQDYIHSTRRILCMRNVKLWLRLGRERFMTRTRHYADDFQRRRLVVVLIENNALANGIASAKKFSHKRFINDHDRR